MTQKLEGKKVRLDGLTNERRARLGTGYGQILAAGILEWYGRKVLYIFSFKHKIGSFLYSRSSTVVFIFDNVSQGSNKIS